MLMLTYPEAAQLALKLHFWVERRYAMKWLLKEKLAKPFVDQVQSQFSHSFHLPKTLDVPTAQIRSHLIKLSYFKATNSVFYT